MNREGWEQYKSNSTVSRYACRILCERKPPYTARVYAAAFDTNKKIKMSVSAHTHTRTHARTHAHTHTHTCTQRTQLSGCTCSVSLTCDVVR